jgi:phosphoglycolate phosphatase
MRRMPRRFDLLVFDWDGTLMDSTAVIAGSLQAACGDVGLPVPSEERARHIIGLGLYDAMRYVLPGVPPSIYPQVVERYRVHFLAREESAPLFAGAEAALKTLVDAGHLLAVATGKSRRGLDRVLERTGLTQRFHATRCGEEAASKPAPAMLLDLQSELGVAKERTLMIGDTTHDLQMAQNAGMAGLAVAFGAHPREQLLACQPLACLDDPAQLWHWLIQHA